MPRGRAQLAYPVAIVVTLAVALLPAEWRLGWSRDVGELVKLLLVPVAHPLRWASGELRPPPAHAGSVDSAQLDELIEERDFCEQMYRQLKMRVESLEEENRQLQNLPPETLRHAIQRVTAHVPAGNANSIYGPLTLTVNGAVAPLIVDRTIAVCDKVHLVGVTVGEPGARSCVLRQIVDPESKPVEARVVPHDDLAAAGVRIQIAATGAGTLEGTVLREDVIHEGDVVHVEDDNWPTTAQGMILGFVESSRIDDQAPLRKIVVVRPKVLASQVRSLTLVVEAHEGEGDAR